MKRITNWPQLFLGLTFNWGALVGWAAVRGQLDLTPLVLYAGCICWTIGYDTIYAHQDKTDDIRIGVKSTALAFGRRTKPLVALFYAVFMAALVAAGILADLHWIFFAALLPTALHFVWQVTTLEMDEPASCKKRFVSNGQVGVLVFLALVLGQVLR
jgi:4-hydroxybenzoate polyprenyltransferase